MKVIVHTEFGHSTSVQCINILTFYIFMHASIMELISMPKGFKIHITFTGWMAVALIVR